MRLTDFILERYDFRTVGREEVEGRPAFLLEFYPRPGRRRLDTDFLLRKLAGRMWVDEAERELVRAEIRNTSAIRYALGLAAHVSAAGVQDRFPSVGGWAAAARPLASPGRRPDPDRESASGRA